MTKRGAFRFWLACMLGSTILAGIALAFYDVQDWGLSIHGFIAMALGLLLSLALGIGLMTLVFYSARSGHDDKL